MRALIGFTLRYWPALALATSIAMLAIAHAFETFGHFAPCTLCLYQRDVYWWALPATALAVVASRLPPARVAAPWLGALMALIFITGCGIAVYHAGAEWKWWPGPQACSSAGGRVSAAALTQLLQGASVHAPHCDEAPWKFLGLSMAGWNALISLKLACWSAAWAVWVRKA